MCQLQHGFSDNEFASTTDYTFWLINVEDLVNRQQLLALGTLKGVSGCFLFFPLLIIVSDNVVDWAVCENDDYEKQVSL